MRTNIEIDDALMTQALAAGPYKTKKEAVEAGLRLVARQAAYREILKWRGKLHWEGDPSIDWTRPDEGTTPAAQTLLAAEPGTSAYAGEAAAARLDTRAAPAAAQPAPRRRARR